MHPLTRRSVSMAVHDGAARLLAWVRRPIGRPGSIYATAAAALVVLNLLDLLITRAALRAGAEELNPISRYFVEHAFLAYTIKVGVPVAILLLAFTSAARRRVNDLHIAAIWAIVGIYTMTVFINVVVWTKHV